MIVSVEMQPGRILCLGLVLGAAPFLTTSWKPLLSVQYQALPLLAFLAVSRYCPLFSPTTLMMQIFAVPPPPGTDTTGVGSVRLFPRNTEDDRVKGSVEVLIDSRWGSVCVPTDHTEVAPSICDGLGYMRGSAMVIGSTDR